ARGGDGEIPRFAARVAGAGAGVVLRDAGGVSAVDDLARGALVVGGDAQPDDRAGGGDQGGAGRRHVVDAGTGTRRVGDDAGDFADRAGGVFARRAHGGRCGVN